MKRLLNIDFALVQAIYWMLYTVAGSFVSVLLLEKNYTNVAIGNIIAVGSVLAIFLQMVITHLTDRSSRLDSIGMIKSLTLLLAAGVAAVLLIGEKSTALTIAYVGVIILHTALHPFVNALSFTLEETGLQVNYGVGRSMGSFAAGGISFVLGYLVVWFRPEIVLYLALVNLALLTLVIFATGYHYKKAISDPEKVPKSSDTAKTPAQQSIGMMEFVRCNRLFALMSLGIVALFFGNVIQENFMLQILQGIGGDTSDMGIVILLLCVCEMPAMIAFHKLKLRFSYVFLLRLSAVFFTIKIFVMYMAGSLAVFYLAQLCQIIGYGLLFPAMVSFIDAIMTKGEALRGQAMFTVAITLGNIIGSVAGGVILDLYSPKMLLLTGTLVSAAGTLLIVLFIKQVSASHFNMDTDTVHRKNTQKRLTILPEKE